jgi:hypothetical protein
MGHVADVCKKRTARFPGRVHMPGIIAAYGMP